jgi:CHAT domain-containing protein/Tfp pilus assembly protein PilF
MFKRITCILLLFILFWIQCAHYPHACASGDHSSLAQLPPPQQSTTTQSAQETTPLELGVPLKREIAGGQRHNYHITLTKGQHIRVEIKPQDIDLGVLLQLPDSKSITVYDPLGIEQKQLVVERVAETSGIHRLNLFTRAKALLGRYEIRLAELRVATENDFASQQARKLFGESRQLTREGKVSEARPLLLRALEIREKVSGPDDLKVAEILEQLAISYKHTGDYASAEPLELRILKIREKAYGPEQPAVADALRSLGVFYYEKGDYLKAEEMIQKALVIFEKARQPESIIIASALSYLGDIYYAWSDYGNAESYYRRALAIREKILGSDHFHLTASLGSIGRVAYDAGDYTKAEAMFGRALTISEKAFGPDHTHITWSLNHLGTLYSTTGDYAKAEGFYRRALSIHEQKTGMYAPNVEATLLGLARLYAAQGLMSEAVKFQLQASELEERYLKLNLSVGSARDKLTLLDNLSLHSSRYISLHAELAPNDSAARDMAVTTILRRKGRAQDAVADSLAALRLRFGAEDRKLLDELDDTTSRLATLALKGSQKGMPAEHLEQVKKLEEEREKLEAEISRRSAGFYNSSQPVTLAAIQQAIPDNTALIEFALYRPFDPKAPANQKAFGEPRYVAYVVRSQGEVQWKELGTARKIDDSIDALRQALHDPKRKDVRQLARTLEDKVMKPVRSLLGETTQLLVSPDGELNLIPFAALIDEQGRYLIERYSFTYLTSGRDLLRIRVPRESKSQPVIVADPTFGEPAILASRGGVGRKAEVGGRVQLDFSQLFFGPLPGVGAEVRALKEILPQATFLTKEQATKAALKRISAPNILHIATHGFFLDNGLVAGDRALTKTNDTTRLGKLVTNVENPLLRSGLALAGANQGLDGDDNGILTALEMAHLDLWGTKLVVLSACDTGVGEVKAGDGVYGLRRALVLAGAESQLMSLWPVSDRSTRDLMIAYYKRLIGGAGRGEALREVQLQILRSKARGHPYYWASFIQIGEWANLKGER